LFYNADDSLLSAFDGECPLPRRQYDTLSNNSGRWWAYIFPRENGDKRKQWASATSRLVNLFLAASEKDRDVDEIVESSKTRGRGQWREFNNC
jgi:hypothetical protein